MRFYSLNVHFQMKTPTMIMIGAEDRRVPPKQSHELRKALLARGVPVK